MIYDNTTIDSEIERAKNKARIADDYAGSGDYMRAIYALTDVVLNLTAALNELKQRGSTQER